MTRKALWQQLDTYPAQWDRQAFAAIFPSPGLVDGMALTVPSGRTVNIAPGHFVVSYGGTLGSALCTSDGTESVTMPAAPAAGVNRIDVITVQIRDAAVDAGTANGFDFVVVSGTASSTPSPPAIPARAGALAFYTATGGETNVAPGNFYGGPVAHPGGGAIVPIGMVIPFAGPTSPSGWLLCDGSAQSRTLYSALFAVIGTTYGAGDGSTTFNVPELRSRSLVGASVGGAPAGLTARARGAIGGEETHLLTAAESAMTDHAHLSNGAGYFVSSFNTGVGYTGVQGGSGGQWANAGTAGMQGGVPGVTAHNNMQPFLALFYLIKAF